MIVRCHVIAQVIGDALPIPSSCPEAVQQLLEAALAHHNLGRYVLWPMLMQRLVSL